MPALVNTSSSWKVGFRMLGLEVVIRLTAPVLLRQSPGESVTIQHASGQDRIVLLGLVSVR